VVEECVSTVMPRLLSQKEAAKLSSAIMKSLQRRNWIQPLNISRFWMRSSDQVIYSHCGNIYSWPDLGLSLGEKKRVNIIHKPVTISMTEFKLGQGCRPLMAMVSTVHYPFIREWSEFPAGDKLITASYASGSYGQTRVIRTIIGWLNWEIRLDRGGVRDVTEFSKTTAKNESQVQMDPFIAEASRENNMSYGLL